MSLALATFSRADFDLIFDHLVTHKPPYRNMHTREARIRRKKRVLWYFNAVQASEESPRLIRGMISGPSVFVEYTITRGLTQARLNVLDERGDPKELARIGRHLRDRMLERVEQERSAKLAGVHFSPQRKPGQYYLKRQQGGMSATHRNCKRAIASKELDAKFVGQLQPWDLRLLYIR